MIIMLKPENVLNKDAKYITFEVGNQDLYYCLEQESFIDSLLLGFNTLC